MTQVVIFSFGQMNMCSFNFVMLIGAQCSCFFTSTGSNVSYTCCGAGGGSPMPSFRIEEVVAERSQVSAVLPWPMGMPNTKVTFSESFLNSISTSMHLSLVPSWPHGHGPRSRHHMAQKSIYGIHLFQYFFISALVVLELIQLCYPGP
jgi:hypothetical protein